MRSPRPTHAVYGFLIAALLSLTASAAVAGETSFSPHNWLPENVFPATQVVDKIFYGILYLTLVVNVLVFAVMAIFLVKFRHREGRHARFIHGNNRLETVWTIVPAVILAMTAVLSESSWSNIKSPSANMATDPKVLHMEIIGRQFAWYFHYPGKDGKLGVRNPTKVNPLSSVPEELVGLDRSDPDSADDLLTNQMYIPVNQKVYTNVTSVDVIHSFFLPNFRIKQDAMPGLRARVWLEASKTSAEVIGTQADGKPKPFDIVCAELCGQGHFTMRGELYVVTPAEYEAFIAKETADLTPAGSGY